MKQVFRWVFVFILLVGTISIGFSIYASLLLDYSLESLQTAVAVTDKTSNETSPLRHNVYRDVVKDLAMEEAAQENIDMKNFVLLDIASRSLGEAEERFGKTRANQYLAQVLEGKVIDRGAALNFFDYLYHTLQGYWETVISLFEYLKNRLFWDEEEQGPKRQKYAGIFVLIQAQERQRAGRLDEAIELYSKYLKQNTEDKDRGYVAIALANIYLQQRNFDKAEKILKDVQIEFSQLPEEQVAGALLQRIHALKEREAFISQIRQLLDVHTNTPMGQRLQLKLALAYFSAYRFDEAEKLLEGLQTADVSEVSEKAKFYLGLLYKINAEYDRSLQTLNQLLEKPSTQEGFGLGLHAQIADIYYLKHEPEKALKHLEILSQEIDQSLSSLKVARDAWRSLAELEQANIYLYDLGDPEKAKLHLDRLEKELGKIPNIETLREGLKQTEKGTLRDRAFEALKQGEIYLAFDLFTRNLVLYPRDAWTYSGLATVYLLFAEPGDAQENAAISFRSQKDEYTISVMGYVNGYLGKFREAIYLYQKAMELNDRYIPAQFNLACMQLELREYEGAIATLEKLQPKVKESEMLLRSKILNNMGFALWWLGYPEQAKEKFSEALRITPYFLVASNNLDQIASGVAPQMIKFKE